MVAGEFRVNLENIPANSLQVFLAGLGIHTIFHRYALTIVLLYDDIVVIVTFSE